MIQGLQPALWHELFATFAGVCAALLGLFFVAISFHVREVESEPAALHRARSGLEALASSLTVSLFALIPGQPAPWLGAEVIVIQLGLLALNLTYAVRTFRHAPELFDRSRKLAGAVGVTAIASMIVGGISLIVGRGPGLFMIMPAVVATVLLGSYFAWSVLFSRPAPRHSKRDH